MASGITILALNAGSSSLKASVYRFDRKPIPGSPTPPLWQARAQWNDSQSDATIQTSGAAAESMTVAFSSPGELFEVLLKRLWDGPAAILSKPDQIDVIGHRIVHGGLSFRETVCVTPQVVAAIEEATLWAPQHNRLGLEGIAAVARTFGSEIPQVAVFDTAFHQTLPPEAYIYPGPYDWFEQGIRRFGFHGISHQHAVLRSAQLLRRDLGSMRMITCHLGNGSSLAAVRDGKCVDTTMGFTPLEGLMMGSRSGSIDPGIILHLIRRGATADEVEETLNHRSGLLGISGVSSDIREVLAAAESGNTRAELALKIYVRRLRFHLSGLIAELDGLDVVVFTGGVGENSPTLRSAACAEMGYCGIVLDEHRNIFSKDDQDISRPDSPVRILVVKSQEEWQIALECLRLRSA